MNREFLEQEMKNIENEYNEIVSKRSKMQEEAAILNNTLIKLEGKFEQTANILNMLSNPETVS
jgi:predicted nuclease with TOPRIM domain